MIGVHLTVRNTFNSRTKLIKIALISTENLSSHRAQQLMALLPRALMYGLTELGPDPEPLRVSLSSQCYSEFSYWK